MARGKAAGPERQRWVNRGGSPLGEEVNKWHMRFRSHPARCSLAAWIGTFIAVAARQAFARSRGNSKPD